MKIKLISLFIIPLCLAACGPSNDATPAPKLFKEQRAVLDQAKAVSGVIQLQDQEQKKEIEQQTQ